MLSIFKMCPKIITIYSKNERELVSYLNKSFVVKKNENQFNSNVRNILSLAKENETIILISNKIKNVVGISDVNYSLIIESEYEEIYMKIINENKSNLIYKIRSGPDFIVMKNYGDIKKFKNIVKKDFNGSNGSIVELLDNNSFGTIILFTDENVNNDLVTNQVNKDAIYSEIKRSKVVNKINVNAIKYINESIEKKDGTNIK